jgi:hypothetical protein
MAADVVFTEESPWYTNSHTWGRITEFAVNRADGPAPGDRQDYLDTLGVDFTFMPDDKAVEVASWLSGVIERMLAEDEIGSGETDREHARTLIDKLRSEIQVRTLRR